MTSVINTNHKSFYGLLMLSAFVSASLIYLTTSNTPFPRTSLNVSIGDIPEKSGNHVTTEWEDWQPLSESNSQFAVYTAYSFERSSVVVITTRAFTEEPVVCQFYVKNFTIIGTTPAVVEPIKDYRGVFLTCPLPSLEPGLLAGERPEFVTVRMADSDDSEPSTNMLRINYNIKAPEEKYRFTFSVCVSPTYDYNQVMPFIEWMEFYKLMGVEQFTFYNMSVGPDMSCILNRLASSQNNGGNGDEVKVNVNQWHNLPLYPREKVGGSPCPACSISNTVAANECLYRHKGVSEFLVFVDLDEFIMPGISSVRNYSDLIKFLDSSESKSKFAEYSFRNVFFPMQRDDDDLIKKRCASLLPEPLAHEICLQLKLMKKIARLKESYEYGVRSKYIARTDAVLQMATHETFKMKEGYKTKRVLDVHGILKHYRNVSKEDSSSESVEDRIPQDFAYTLARKVATQVMYFQEICGLNITSKIA